MGFAIHPLYHSESVERILTAILVIIALKSFEFIIKAVVLSSGRARLNTATFSLRKAMDEAYNPVNYLSWFRANPDFPPQYSPLASSPPPYAKQNRIPLNRAALAILLAALTIIAEATFFYFSLPTATPLSLGHLQLAVNQTNTAENGRTIKVNSCAPVAVNTGRATLSAVFAFCNQESGNVQSVSGPLIKQTITRTHYSLKVSLTVPGTNTYAASETMFSLLLPTDKNLNLVVRLRGNQKMATSNAISSYWRDQNCDFDSTGTSADILLRNCAKELRPRDILQFLLTHIAVVQNETKGDIGYPQGDEIIRASGKIVLGQIFLQRATAVGVLSLSVFLFVIAIVLYFAIPNDSSQVIAALLRRETGQDVLAPAVALGDRTLQVSTVFDEEKHSWTESIANIHH